MPQPTSADTVVYGGSGYIEMAPKLSTGANDAVTVPTRVSKIGPLKFSYTATNSSDNDIKAATNRPGEEITATPAFALSSATNNLMDCKITFSFLESTVDHLEWYRYVRGKYFAIYLPLGIHGANYVNYFAFGVFDDGGDINIDGDKPTEVSVTFTVKKNTAAVPLVAPAVVTDYGPSFSFVALTIAVGYGEKVSTVAV